MLRQVMKRTRLSDMDIEEVSIVGRAANGEKFVVIKADLPGEGEEDQLKKSGIYSNAVAKDDKTLKSAWEALPLMPLWELSDLVVPDLSTMKSHPVVVENLQMMLKHIGEFFVKLDDALGKVQKDRNMFPDDVVFPADLAESIATIGKAFGLVLDIHKGDHPGLVHGKAATTPADDQKKETSELRALLQGLLGKAAVGGADHRENLEKAKGLIAGYQDVCKALEGRHGRLADQIADSNRQVRALKARTFSRGALDPDEEFSRDGVRKNAGGGGGDEDNTDWGLDLADEVAEDMAAGT